MCIHGPAAVAAFVGSAVVCTACIAGPLAPPSGPVAPTLKAINQVEPRIPIGPDTTPGDGLDKYIIRQSGSYYLTGDVNAGTLQNGIKIDAFDVTIDLSGYTLRGQSFGRGIYVNIPSGPSHVVRNGTVSGFGIGIGELSGGAVVERVRVTNCTTGISLEEGRSTVRDCIAQDCTLSGIVLSGGPPAEYGAGIVESCVVEGCGSDGIRVFGGALISRCTVIGNHQSGIFAEDSIVTDCLVTGSLGDFGQPAMDLRRSIARRCVVEENAGDGIDSTSSSLIEDCVVRLNGGFGISVEDGSLVGGCDVQVNSGDAIRATNHCSILRNTVEGNGSGILGEDACLVAQNVSNGHASGFGIRVFDDCRVVENTCSENAFGISVSTACTVEDNTASKNFTGIVAFESCRISRNTSSDNTNNAIEVGGRESLIESNWCRNGGGIGFAVLDQRNLILKNVCLAPGTSQGWDLAANNRVGKIGFSTNTTGVISGDSDSDATGVVGLIGAWINLNP